jgi:hypothetical protein
MLGSPVSLVASSDLDVLKRLFSIIADPKEHEARLAALTDAQEAAKALTDEANAKLVELQNAQAALNDGQANLVERELVLRQGQEKLDRAKKEHDDSVRIAQSSIASDAGKLLRDEDAFKARLQVLEERETSVAQLDKTLRERLIALIGREDAVAEREAQLRKDFEVLQGITNRLGS